MTNAELREFCTQMIGKFKLLSDIQKEMQYETIDAKFTEWELKKLIFALNVLREEVRKYVDTADTPQTETSKTIPLNEWLSFKEYVLEMDGEGGPRIFRIIPMSEYKLQNQELHTDCGWGEPNE